MTDFEPRAQLREERVEAAEVHAVAQLEFRLGEAREVVDPGEGALLAPLAPLRALPTPEHVQHEGHTPTWEIRIYCICNSVRYSCI